MNLTKKLAAMFVTALMVLSMATPTFAETIIRDGQEFIRVTGTGFGPKGANPNGSFYKSFARQTAKFDALRQFAEVIGGIHTDYNKSTDEFIDEFIVTIKYSDEIMSRIEKEARQIGDAKFNSDGSCEVIMEMPQIKIID